MTKVKLCGMKRPTDIDAVNAVLPDYIGFVFAPKSKRAITPAAAKHLRQHLHPFIQAVGVFVNAPLPEILHCLDHHIIDVVQLHGNEHNAFIAALREKTRASVIQAFSLATPADVKCAQRSIADYVLLDHGSGGSGHTFDWSLAQNINRPYFLAGGLHSDNVAEAIGKLQPFAVDTSSGIETAGHKDPQKINAFVQTIRSIH